MLAGERSSDGALAVADRASAVTGACGMVAERRGQGYGAGLGWWWRLLVEAAGRGRADIAPI
jgi:hypothetical protein